MIGIKELAVLERAFRAMKRGSLWVKPEEDSMKIKVKDQAYFTRYQ